MAAKRQLELYLLRFLPHALRDDFVTVGLLLLESDGGFAEVRFTRDWRMLQCVAPDVELEWFEMVEREIRGKLGSLRRREELMQLMSERFGTMLDVAPTKAVLTGDPAKEMDVLTSMYLVPMGTRRAGAAAHRTGCYCEHDARGVRRCGGAGVDATRFGCGEVHGAGRSVPD